jgi:hypothetical protein
MASGCSTGRVGPMSSWNAWGARPLGKEVLVESAGLKGVQVDGSYERQEDQRSAEYSR